MCRSDIDPAARVALAAVLDGIATTLADQTGVNRDEVLIGPVDFGGSEDE